MSFYHNFIAKGENFNRKLIEDEKQGLTGFPNANISNIGFLGIGSVRPDSVSCEYYECLSAPVHMYDSQTGQYRSTIQTSASEIDVMQLIWDKCHSGNYTCIYQGHFGATYNCIGWALGVTKWLNPNEITEYIQEGKSREEAIELFLNDKSKVFAKNKVSVVDPIMDNLSPIDNLPNTIANNTVAFFFDSDGECQHGARYLHTLNAHPLNRWTSKLGSSITIAHDLQDLAGEKSIYGNELLYVATSISGETDDL